MGSVLGVGGSGGVVMAAVRYFGLQFEKLEGCERLVVGGGGGGGQVDAPEYKDSHMRDYKHRKNSTI